MDPQIQSIHDQITSPKVAQRVKGVDSLSDFLFNHEITKTLNDADWKPIITALTASIYEDRKSYRRATDQPHGNGPSQAVVDRLTQFSGVLRHLVEIGYSVFLPKTAKDLINHIVESILWSSSSNDHLCQPLLKSYSKILELLFNYQPILNNLKADQWEAVSSCIAKCITAVVLSCIDTENSSNTVFSLKSRIPQSCTDLFAAMKSLISNPIVSRPDLFRPLFTHIAYFLKIVREETISHIHAFACSSIMINELLLNDITFCQEIAYTGISSIISLNLNSRRNLPLNEQIYIFLLDCYNPLRSLAEDPNNDTRPIIKSLRELFRIILFIREEQSNRISLNDLWLIPSDNIDWFTYPLFRSRSVSTLSTWTSTLVIYRMISLFSTFKDDYDDDDNDRKRFRTNNGSTINNRTSSSIDQQLMNLVVDDINPISALQIVAISYQLHPSSSATADLVNYITTSFILNPSVERETSSWAMICIASIIHKSPLAISDELWNACIPKIHNKDTSSAACFCINVIMATDLSRANLESVLGMFDSYSPIISGGSLQLSLTLLSKASTMLTVTASKSAKERLLTWLLNNWQTDIKVMNPIITYGSYHAMLFSSVEISNCLFTFFGCSTVANIYPNYFGSVAEASFQESSIEEAWYYLHQTKIGDNMIDQTTTIPPKSKPFYNSTFVKTTIDTLIDTLKYTTKLLSSVISNSNDRQNSLPMPELSSVLHVLLLNNIVIGTLGKIFENGQDGIHYRSFLELCNLTEELASSFSLFSAQLPTYGTNSICIHFSGTILSSVRKNFLNPKAQTVFRSTCKSIHECLLSCLPTIDDKFNPIHSITSSHCCREINIRQVSSTLDLISNGALKTTSMFSSIDQLTTRITSEMQTIELFLINTNNCYEHITEYSESFLPRHYTIILEYLGLNLLSSRTYKLSEVSIESCIKFLLLGCYECFDPISETIHNEASTYWHDILKFIIKLVFHAPVRSPRIRILLCELFSLIMQKFNADDSILPLVYESLAEALDEGTGSFNYYISSVLSNLLSKLSYKNQLLLYPKIIQGLGPLLVDVPNICFRSNILASFAETNGDIMVFAVCDLLSLVIVEGPSSDHLFVRKSMERISKFYNFTSGKELLKVISNPIFSFWMKTIQEKQADTPPFNIFPYHVFNFETEKEFMESNIIDICSKVVVLSNNEKARDQYLKHLSTVTKVPLKSIYSASVYKSIAYGFIELNIPLDELHKTISERIKPDRTIQACISDQMVDILTELLSTVDISSYKIEFPTSSALAPCANLPPLVSPVTTLGAGAERVKRYIDFITGKNISKLLGRAGENITSILRGIFNVYGKHSTNNAKHLSLRRCLFLLSILLQENDSAPTKAAKRKSSSAIDKGSIHGYTLELCLRAIVNLISIPETKAEACLVFQLLLPAAPNILLIELGFRVLQTFLDERLDISEENQILLNEITTCLVSCVEYWEAHILTKSINYLLKKNNGFSDSDVVKIITGDESQLYFPPTRKCCWDMLSFQLESGGSLLESTHDSHVSLKLLTNMRDYCPKSKAFTTWCGRLIGKSFLSNDTLSLTSPESAQLEFYISVSTEETLSQWYDKEPIFCSIVQMIARILQDGDFQQLQYVERCLCVFQQNITIDRQTLLDNLPGHLLDGTSGKVPKSYITKKRKTFLTIKEPNGNFLSWVQGLSFSLLNFIKESQPIFQGLEELVENIPESRPILFPVLVHQLLANESSNEIRDRLCSIFNYYFDQALEEIKQDEKVLEILVDTILYLRMFDLVDSDGFPINWEGAAMSAASLSRFKTAMMFLEIHWNNSGAYNLKYFSFIWKSIKYPDMYDAVPVIPSLESSVESSMVNSTNHQSLIYSMFFESAIQNAAVCGYSSSGTASKHSTMALANVVNQTGLYSIADNIIQSYSTLEHDYSSSWKLEKWDLPSIETPNGKNEMLYQLFKNLNDFDDFKESSQIFTQTYSDALSNMLTLNQPPYSELFQILAITSEAEQVFNMNESDIMKVLTSQRTNTAGWNNYDDFNKIDDILVARQINWRLLQNRLSANIDISSSTMSSIASAFSCSFIDHDRLALKDGNLLKAINSVVKFLHSKLPEQFEAIKIASKIESASICWASGHQSAAIAMLKSVITLDSFCSASQKAGCFFSRSNVHAKLANWLSLAKHEGDQTILDKYFDPALAYKEKDINDNPLESGTELFHIYGSFCDEKFRSETLNNEFTRQSRLREDKDKRIAELSKSRILGSENRALKKRLEKQRVTHDQEYRRLNDTIRTFLFKSINNYLDGICYGDEYIGDVSRFLDLWFANASNSIYSSPLNLMVSRYSARLPSVKLIPWMNQLSSKMTLEVNEFQRTLWNLVEKVCKDHPHHTIYHIIALKSSSKQEERYGVGAKFLDRLKAKKLVDLGLLVNFEQLALKIVETAKIPPPKQANGSVLNKLQFDKIATGQWWLKTLPTLQIPMPTADIELRPDRDYRVENLPVVKQILKQVTIANGINRPKVISVVDSKGRTTSILIKGGDKDDLRQDAVMEQVFEQVNGFFKKDSKSRIRNLRVRTYKIVPLGKGGGTIEFVNNTSSFAAITQALHRKYRPNDMTADVARMEMQKVEGDATAVKVEVYKGIEQKLQPAFRYFFFERFFSPEEWFYNRALYSRSTAVNSMIGYVLGLGDRHCSNILVDKLTGEIIHIDLGIAFGQGKELPIPELVPFRLTRDVVDGMGMSGVSGVFQKSCEITLSVLREEIEAITTILNVLRYDPLYTWTMSDTKKHKLQGGWQDSGLLDEAEIGTEAVTAIAEVRNRLSTNLSIEATVREQIQGARDVKNLAVLFRGE